MENKQRIELLAPAKNVEFGIQAINQGADATYIGAPSFGARAAASNTISDIERLIRYAHLFRAKVYIALNTILFDNELGEVEKLIHSLYRAGADGLIIQDMGILELNLPPIPLIASTQTNNTTLAKVQFLENIGFKRVILARELSLDEIKEIHRTTTVELESFVHGALCVSYSGQCYMSQTVCGRSGNRGVCAQPCRSAYDLIDSNGEKLVQNKHLLSLKDLNLAENIEEMMDAGITSFKIEGRLKDLTYIKNVVSFYRQAIDRVLLQKKHYQKSSSGSITFHFKADPDKSFNRGFTNYYIHGRKEKTGSFLTPKSLGKRMGVIAETGPNWFSFNSEELSNGDGICFFGKGNSLLGTSVNKTLGTKVFPKDMDGLQVGIEVYRNHDQQFEKQLEKEVCERKIGIELWLNEWEHGFKLKGIDEDVTEAEVTIEAPKELAERIDLAREQTIKQLSKWGDTVFGASKVTIETQSVYFIPASVLNQMRRDLAHQIQEKRISKYQAEQREFRHTSTLYPLEHLTYKENVLNSLAEKFYQRHGVKSIEPAFEKLQSFENRTVMTTKHCIRYQLDACPVHQSSAKRFNEPLYLKDNNHTYRLQFDCKMCVMNVIFEK